MNNEIVEKIAKVCFEKLCPGIRYIPLDKEAYEEAIVAVIKAMREPTEKQLNAAWEWSRVKYGKPIGNDAATGCWQTMIDAITNDG